LTLFFTGDTHFGDPRVLRIDKRPFPTIAEHDEALVERWISAVSTGDDVWHLGHFALRVEPERIDALLARLHGRKHLIVGNNDGPATLAAFPRLATLAGAPSVPSGKCPVDARDAYPGRALAAWRPARGATLAVFPTVTDAGETTLAPIPKAEAFGHLLASSAALLIDGIANREESLTLLRDLLEVAVCRELRLGRDALLDPRSVVAARIERELAGAGR
jgi:hypothetical protein